MTQTTPGRIPTWTLGERIRKAREDAGLSQQQFADRLGVDRKSVTNWEGNRHAPRYRDVMLVSLVADVDLGWLAGDDYQPAAEPASIAQGRQASNRGYSAWPHRRTSPFAPRCTRLAA